MRFGYTEIPNNQDRANPFRRPYLIVRLIHGSKHKDVISLVDSGADLCLFHSDIGKMLGLDLKSGSELIFHGVSGAREVAYLHHVNLRVGGLDRITLEVGFTDSMAVGTGLLGQRGFFEQFHISFELDKRLFEIIDT